MQVASNNPPNDVAVRVLIFAVVGISLSAAFVENGISTRQAVTTIAIFAALNGVYELMTRRNRS